MTDLDRVLDSLLHDLRSPLGVAGGYLRLLREGRLANADETERAIVKAQDALRTMTTLCGDATEWLTEDTPGDPTTVATGTLTTQIVGEAARAGVTVEGLGGPDGVVTLQHDAGRVARAVASLLSTVTRAARARCTARSDNGVLRVSATVTERHGPGGSGTFDPWAFPGLAAALACRSITKAGGRCLRGPEAADVVHVEFDLDASQNASSP